MGNPEAILTWLQGTSDRAGRVVDPPKQPRPRQLLVVHRPDLAESPARRRGSRAAAKSLLLLPVARPRPRPSPSTCGAPARRSSSTTAPCRGRSGRSPRSSSTTASDACIVCTSTLELGHRRRRPRPGAAGRGAGHGELVPPAHGPHRAARRARSRTPRSSARRPRACCRRSPSSSWPRRAGSSRSRSNDRCWPVLIHQLLAMSLAGDGVTAEDAWEHLVARARLPRHPPRRVRPPR